MSGRRSRFMFESAPGPDGERLSKVGWEDWPKITKDYWGLVYISSLDRFGYYDDVEFVEEVNDDIDDETEGSTNHPDGKKDLEDEICGRDFAIVYLGAPLVSEEVRVDFSVLFKPPFQGKYRAL